MMTTLQTPSPSLDTPLNLDDLLARCLGRAELAAKIVHRFQGTLQEDLAALERAAADGDAEVVARVAHRIKGASLTVGAQRLGACAQRLVDCGPPEVGDYLAELKAECVLFQRLDFEQLLGQRSC